MSYKEIHVVCESCNSKYKIIQDISTDDYLEAVYCPFCAAEVDPMGENDYDDEDSVDELNFD